MRVLVTGASGQVGSEVAALLIDNNIDYIAIDRNDLDITDEAAVCRFFKTNSFSHVVHCAAYTDVNGAEKDKKKCLAANTDATRCIAGECAKYGMTMIYISTDYVFSGEKDRPYLESDKCRPINYYGLTKLLGDGEVLRIPKKFIIRTSWIFGEGNNFVKTMIRLSKNGEPIRVVNDQTGSPTYAKDLAVIIIEMLYSDKYGIFNVTNEGYCTWYEFAEEIMHLSGSSCEIVPVTTDEYPTLAKRPRYSCLSKEKMRECGFTPMPEWKDALSRYINNYIQE